MEAWVRHGNFRGLDEDPGRNQGAMMSINQAQVLYYYAGTDHRDLAILEADDSTS